MGAEGERGLVKENHMEAWCDSEGVKHLNNKKKKEKGAKMSNFSLYRGDKTAFLSDVMRWQLFDKQANNERHRRNIMSVCLDFIWVTAADSEEIASCSLSLATGSNVVTQAS